MRQVTQNLSDGKVRVVDVPVPVLGAHGVLVSVERSLVSVGTERAKVELGRSSLIDKARRRPDDVKKVLDRVRRDGLLNTYRMVKGRLEQDSPLGYSAAGTVLAVGELVAGIRAGDRVACAGAGYANHAELIVVPGSLCARVPDTVAADSAAFTTLGAIAMQGVRQAQLTFGDTVLVVGMGLLGLLTTQIAKAAGYVVVGFDPDPHKIELALQCGADAAVSGGHDEVLAQVAALTAGRGADAVVITASTRSNDPVRLAGEAARDRAAVVVVGSVGMDIPRSPYYEKELSVHLSRSYGPGRYDPMYEEFGVDYPEGYVRWTERRNMEEFLRLMGTGDVRTDLVTTHRFAIEDAPEAYDLLVSGVSPGPIGVLLEYANVGLDEAGLGTKPAVVPRVSGVALGVGLVGAGNFATSTLVPALKGAGVELRGIVTASGLSANDVAQREGFSFAGASIDELLSDERTEAVVVATRHDSHASLVKSALDAGRHVFCEKPLALTRNELDSVVESWVASDATVMVGFNRRYAPSSRRVREAVAQLGSPATISIRVNAGAISSDHWIQRLEQGGGRIVGEACHFVDLASYLGGGRVTRLAAFGVDNGKAPALQDSFGCTMTMDTGSVATLTYTSDGDTSLPKELIEVFCGGNVWIIDDFRSLSSVIGGKTVRSDAGKIDKGHSAEIAEFVAVCDGRGSDDSSFAHAVAASDATFAIVESIASGASVSVTDRGLSRG